MSKQKRCKQSHWKLTFQANDAEVLLCNIMLGKPKPLISDEEFKKLNETPRIQRSIDFCTYKEEATNIWVDLMQRFPHLKFDLWDEKQIHRRCNHATKNAILGRGQASK